MKRHDAIRLMRTNLLRRRSAIRKSLENTCSQLSGTIEREVGDSVDFALDAEHHEISSQLAQVESAELAQIDVALERMSVGEYGVCDDCECNIPIARLQAVPYATLCVNCQREQELAVRDRRDLAYRDAGNERWVMANGSAVGD